MSSDSGILGYWVMYLLFAAVIIGGTYAWIDSKQDDVDFNIKVLEEDFTLLFKTLSSMEGNITINYWVEKRFEVQTSDGYFHISYDSPGYLMRSVDMIDLENVKVVVKDDASELNRLVVIRKNG